MIPSNQNAFHSCLQFLIELPLIMAMIVYQIFQKMPKLLFLWLDLLPKKKRFHKFVPN